MKATGEESAMISCIYAPVKENTEFPPPPTTPGYRWGLVINSMQKATNAPPCRAGNSRKCPTPGATEDVTDELVVE